jgi:MoaA/NifB/PqqE/SkfB family radical SAM enzyme
MKIHNVRMGLATNSSSSHSIIMLPSRAKGSKLKDNYDGDDFGWGDFTLVNKENKNVYLASTLFQSLRNAVGHEFACAVVEKWTGVAPKANPEYGEYYPSIDHQSVMTFPLDWEEKAVPKRFFDAFKAFVERDDVAILGGNDNSDGHPALSRKGITDTNHMGLPVESSSKGLICREDNGYWVIFDRKTGTKVRLSFNQPEGFEPTKAKAPELVDIKITDYCPFGCEYCYQGSTPRGEHTQLALIKNLARDLGAMETFEVALGGGEPTMHPDFVEILKAFRDNHIVPNFTTKSTHWIKDEAMRKAILEHAGSFAFSVENGKEAQEIIKMCENFNIHEDWATADKRLVLHYVMGVGTEQDFKDVLKAAREGWIEVTLLGYKTNGRGHLVTPKSNGNWVQYVTDLHAKNQCPKLGIDTKLAQVSSKELEEAKISKKLYHTEEGKFSMYIDAVNGLIAPSSYCEAEEMQMLELPRYNGTEVLLKHFNTF